MKKVIKIRRKMLILILVCIIILGVSENVSAEDESVVSSTFVIEAGDVWEYYNNSLIFQNGDTLFGRLDVTASGLVDFFIADQFGYDEWIANKSMHLTLYSFIAIGEIDIRYRHNGNDTPLYFVCDNTDGMDSKVGSIKISIDRTGPEITTDLDDGFPYSGTIIINMAVWDEIFYVVGGRITVLDEILWETELPTPQVTLHAEFELDTTIYLDGALFILFEGWDEGGNVASGNITIYLDNYPDTTTDSSNAINWFGVMTMTGIFIIIAVPVGLVLRSLASIMKPKGSK